MKIAEFIKSINSNNGKMSGSVFLIEGEDAYFRFSALSALKNLVSEPELNYTEFDGGSVDLNQLISSANAFPFMSELRLTVVKEFYPDKSLLKGQLKNYLENPLENSVLAIINEKYSDGLKRFCSVVTVDCGKADKFSILQWIKSECSSAGVGISQTAADKICEFCLSDMCRIENEVNKLISFVGAGCTISDEDVNELVSRDSEYKIYEMTDYIAKKKFDKAVYIINDMISRGETPQRLLISIYNYFRKLLHVSISGASTGKIASYFGIKEFAVKKTLDQSMMFKKRSLKKAVDFLEETDYKLKTGMAEANSALWLSIFKIMTE